MYVCVREKLVSRLAWEGTRAEHCTEHLSPGFRILKDISEGASLAHLAGLRPYLALFYVREEAASVHPRFWEQAGSLALCESGDSNSPPVMPAGSMTLQVCEQSHPFVPLGCHSQGTLMCPPQPLPSG